MIGFSSVLDRARELEDEEEPARNREAGVVKWWNRDKGFGFVTTDGGGDVFCHVSELKTVGRSELETGERVSFTRQQSPHTGREQAAEVQLIEPPEIEGDEDAPWRNRRSAASNAKRAEWIEQSRPVTASRPRLPTDGPLAWAVLDTATLRAPEPAAEGAWQGYLRARERAGDNHPAVVKLDLAWGERSQAAGTPEKWAKLAEWFDAWAQIGAAERRSAPEKR